ncbi:MAG TPA: hypothetical protein VKA63_07435 [Candidatus Krumholzibacteria bacterium]|nr:hypothetical protein [Candidatus Krumholzibacteria bacterium]
MGGHRGGVGDDESQTYLVSVSDLMAGLIFLFIITLMIFVFRYQSAAAEIRSANETRHHLLETLQDSLRMRGLKVEIDDRTGVLRLTEKSINFPVGSSEPELDHIPRVRVLAEILAKVLPCYVPTGGHCPTRRSPDLAGEIQALMIEGHTDTLHLGSGSRLRNNLELSGARAATIERLLIGFDPVLDSLRNQDSLKILSISGYGAERLLDPKDPLTEKNRRIDLRFIMEAPRPVSSQRLPEPVRLTTDSLRARERR